jgi:hypothetical protein
MADGAQPGGLVLDDLGELAARIQREHEACSASFKRGLEHAIACGYLLNQAKAKLGHGTWLAWLKLECPDINKRTAQSYMRLAAHRPLIEAKCATVAHLTINAALDLIAAKGRKARSKPAYIELAPDKFARVREPAAEELEPDSQVKYECEIDREMPGGAAETALCTPGTELAHHAHTRSFECAPSYDPDEEGAQEPADGKSFEDLSAELGPALLRVSRIVNEVTARFEERTPKEEYSLDKSLPAILATAIKNLQDFDQALRRWNSEAGQTAGGGDA